ncbi:DUF2169 domain-containing protein [Sorangium sp. So ce295]|uniref:DUF2169 family type VI secretion system accessory protein n=1 Tax=Sorangium sp. So ce295 TaxID=3133295 RepID=UPI003F5EFF3F
MRQGSIESLPITSHCPLQATSFVWQTADRRRSLTLLCKATYELSPGLSPLAQDQDEICAEDVPWEGDERNSLRAPSDLVPFKRRADVLVTGHVYAPHGQPVRSLIARLSAGTVNKAIAVYGERSVQPSGELSQPAEFTRLPLCWERAAGGRGTSNPAGIAPAPFGPAGGPSWAPNFQQPGIYVASAHVPIPPSGMGPIAPGWPDRSERLGRSAALWDHRNWHAHPLPDDIDAAYFNSAPPDQQVDRLAPDERIALENLHPEHPRLVTRLDGVVPRVVLRAPHQPERWLDLRCDTLWIDTDRGVCCVTWRGSVPYEVARKAEIHVTADGGRLAPSAAESTVFLGKRDLDAALDRDEGASPGGVPEAAVETTAIGSAASMGASPLPFAPAAPGMLAGIASSVEHREHRAAEADPTGTVLAPLFVSTRELPIGWTGGQGAPSPAWTAVAPEPTMEGPIDAAPEQEPPSESDAPTERPPPPAMLAAIALADEQAPAPGDVAEPAGLDAEPEVFAIERWAEISAEIDKAHRSRAEVLGAHQLTERDFTAVERHWKAALEAEAASAGFSLRFKHDEAYVGALERLRERPLSVPEYARILAAGGRRQVVETLHDLEMPEAAHLPIVRLWTARLARDPKLSIEMIQAVAALRERAASPATTTP